MDENIKGYVKDGYYNLCFNADGTMSELDDSNYVKRAGTHLICYDQKEVIAKIQEAYENNNLSKGLFQDYGYEYRFSFKYKYIDANDKVHTPYIRLSMKKELLDVTVCSMNYSKLRDISDEIVRMKKLNRLRIERERRKLALKRKQRFVKIVAGALAGSLAIAGIAYGVKASNEHDKEMRQMEIDKINKQRMENGIPPLGVVDKDGNQYKDWNDYYKDLGKTQNNVDSEKDILHDVYSVIKEKNNTQPSSYTPELDNKTYDIIQDEDTESFHL
ncbi:MAG: hypothetical protein IJ134_02170 [Bacilli bacterium]|nr:hypothetical protein [Bacilli bacterium]